jgi:hypothetical protein
VAYSVIGQPFVGFGQPRSKPGEPQNSSRDTLMADGAPLWRADPAGARP